MNKNDSPLADRIRKYSEEVRSGPWIVQAWVCTHPDVEEFWLTGSLRAISNGSEISLNCHFILKNGDRKDIYGLKDIEDMKLKAEEFVNSLSVQP